MAKIPESTHTVTVSASPGRIAAQCEVCKQDVDARNKGMGRAFVAAFITRHQHPEQTRSAS